MNEIKVGNEWLKEYFKITGFSFTHSSYIGNNNSIDFTSKGNVIQTYSIKYAPNENTPLANVEFALKYDDLSLDFLHAVFKKISPDEVEDFINRTPGGRYTRKIGFLYEFLTGKALNIINGIKGNYVDVLDDKKYITGKNEKNSKWHVNNNLPGSAGFCPIVRKTSLLQQLLERDIKKGIEGLKNNFTEEVFIRATNFLFTKETRSSFEIEREKPSADRMNRFIALLAQAGTMPVEDVLAETNLVQLQKAIVDQRFAAEKFRNFQNYIGQLLPNYHSLVHYICPPPAMLYSLMKGLQHTAVKTQGTDARIRAAIISFSFVFMHPFEDGNGRLHRFLIHDILVHDKAVPHGLIIPVSAHMLNNARQYDSALEAYSKPLMQKIRYNENEIGEVTITNAAEVESYFRYPDLTEQCIYLIETIHATLERDMPDEMLFIQRYDEAKREIQSIVDMPDKDINMLLIFMHNNQGKLPKRKRDLFAKLSDDEIATMQNAYKKIFNISN